MIEQAELEPQSSGARCAIFDASPRSVHRTSVSTNHHHHHQQQQQQP